MLPILGVWYVTLMSISFVIVCLFMLLVILIQTPKGGGLSGAFGGSGGSSQTAFGAKTGDVLTWFTVSLFVIFLLLAMGLTWTIKPEDLTHTQQTAPAKAEDTPADSTTATDATTDTAATTAADKINQAATATTAKVKAATKAATDKVSQAVVPIVKKTMKAVQTTKTNLPASTIPATTKANIKAKATAPQSATPKSPVTGAGS